MIDAYARIKAALDADTTLHRMAGGNIEIGTMLSAPEVEEPTADGNEITTGIVFTSRATSSDETDAIGIYAMQFQCFGPTTAQAMQLALELDAAFKRRAPGTGLYRVYRDGRPQPVPATDTRFPYALVYYDIHVKGA